MSDDRRKFSNANENSGNDVWTPYVPPRQSRPPARPAAPGAAPATQRVPPQYQPAPSGTLRTPAATPRPRASSMQAPGTPYAALRQPVRQSQPSNPVTPTRQRRRGGVAIIAAVCILLAVASGFLGGYFANIMRQADYDTGSPSVSSPSAPVQASEATPHNEPAVPDYVTPSILTNTTGNSLMTIPEVAAAVRESVVEIKTETITSGGWRGDYLAEGAGSGVIISADGYIVTNNHVISGAESITVRLSDGSEYSAMMLGTDAKTDIAIIKISASGLSPAVFGDSSKLVVGETAIAVGNPLGELGGTVTSGIISALDRDIIVDGETMSLLQTDAAVNPGNSGGGLFNLHGELIGVVNAKSGGLNIEGLGFAVPANTAKAVVNDLSEYGYVRGRVDDGFELVDIQTTQAARMYRVNQAGLYIYSSQDERLLSGDRITAVGDAMITQLSEYNEAMKDRVVGDVVSITVARGTQTLTFDIELKEWKP